MRINANSLKISLETINNKNNYKLNLDAEHVEEPVSLKRTEGTGDVSLTISDAGQKKLEINQSNVKVEEQITRPMENFNTEEPESDAYTEYLNRMNTVLDKIGKGETVSQKDRDWLNGELNSIMTGHYSNLVNIKLSREDVLESLASNANERKRIMFDMLKEIEANDNAFQENFAFLQDEFEIKDKEELVERLTEALEEEEENQAEETEETTKEEEVEENEQAISLNHDRLENEKLADKQISIVSERIDSIGEQANKEESDSLFYSNMVNDAYENTLKMINSDEFSYEEKAMATKDFMEKSYEGTIEKEKSRIKSDFDRETVRIASRFFNQHNDISEILKRNRYKVNYISQDIAQNLIIMRK